VELQRQTSGLSKSRCIPANASQAPILQRDDVIGKLGEHEYHITCALSTHPAWNSKYCLLACLDGSNDE
jgi:hypothetical protein